VVCFLGIFITLGKGDEKEFRVSTRKTGKIKIGEKEEKDP
jgi:hypothetical protein